MTIRQRNFSDNIFNTPNKYVIVDSVNDLPPAVAKVRTLADNNSLFTNNAAGRAENVVIFV